MDLGASALGVAVPPERDGEPVRVVATFTPDLHALVDRLVAGHSDTVARASTGSYRVPIVALLAPRGLTPSLVHARQVKTAPGRQTDGNDAPWLQKLHARGLWQASFRPAAELCIVRTLRRHRAGLIEPRAPPSLHLPKALTLMDLQLREGLTASTGLTGQAILRALGQGARDPLTLAQ
jgi:transposase